VAFFPYIHFDGNWRYCKSMFIICAFHRIYSAVNMSSSVVSSFLSLPLTMMSLNLVLDAIGRHSSSFRSHSLLDADVPTVEGKGGSPPSLSFQTPLILPSTRLRPSSFHFVAYESGTDGKQNLSPIYPLRPRCRLVWASGSQSHGTTVN
jgi:hypothetical protein